MISKNTKIGLIGYGYWGKILYKTLLKLGYKNITLCDVSGGGDIVDYTQLETPYVLIATPPSTHYKICDHFLRRGVNVFCEKPLVTNLKDATELYNIAKKTGAKLFTDWTFTYNYAIQKLKQEYNDGLLGEIESISMHRYNENITHITDGTTCKWDLACHDVSIIQYITSVLPNSIKLVDYSKKNKDLDSAFGLLTYDNFASTINVSWTYGDKFRECIFDFTGVTIIWNDKIQKLIYRPKQNSHFWGETIDYSSEKSPLENSISSFLNEEENEINKKITLQTLEILK